MRFSIFIFIFFLFGCKGAKNLGKTDLELDSIEEILTYQEENRLQFATLELKGKCKYRDEERSVTFNTIIRMQKDEQIWISGRYFGFEGVRALITPDSVKIVNRLEREYIQKSIDELQDYIPISTDFYTLQNIIIGGNIRDLQEPINLSFADDYMILFSEQETQKHELIFNQLGNQLVTQFIQINDMSADIEYEKYQSFTEGQFPMQMKMQFRDEEIMSAEVNYSQVLINEELSFPFSIPRNYKLK